MKKVLPLVLILNSLLLIGLYFYLVVRPKSSNQPMPSPPTPQVENIKLETPKPSYATTSANFIKPATESAVSSQTGIVSGKLCFPSEIIPSGKIEAKRIEDGKQFSKDYPGIQTAKSQYYSLDLPVGSYNLRFKSGSEIGYHSTACATGSETTCSDTKPRTLLSARVERNEKVENFDLCDFYYTDKNAPLY